jgi:primosomal protein N' (replication factor Y)
MPFHYAVRDASTQDFNPFADAELRRRKLMRYPPFARLTALTLNGRDYDKVRTMARRLGDAYRRIEHAWPQPGVVSLVGVSPPPIARLQNRWRWRVLLRGDGPGALHDFLKAGLERFGKMKGRSHVQLQVDVDPADLM